MRTPLTTRTRAALALAAALLAAGPAAAQIAEYPYYGKNRINYERLDWRIYPTDHFKIYHTVDDLEILKFTAEAAEAAYRRLSGLLKHELSEPVPILYYKTFTDFEQSNLFQPSEGVLGVSEPVLYRIGMYGDMARDQYLETMEHELSHVFQFDLLWGKQGAALYAVNQPPLWVFEGLSEFAAGEWSTWSELIVRDAVLNDRFPDYTDGGDLVERYPMPRPAAYDFGHALYDFMHERFGEYAIRTFWNSLKTSPFTRRRDPVQRAFDMKAKDFYFEFKKSLRAKNREFQMRENPEDYGFPLGPEYPTNPYYWAFSHDVSPSGELAATMTANIRDQDYDIVLISTRDGSVIRNLTPGFTTRYDYLKFDIDAANGRNLAWAPDGDRIAFFARKGHKHALVVIDAFTGRVLRQLRLNEVDQPAAPVFLPDGGEVLFSAFQEGRRDLFKVRLADGAVENLTRDDLFERAPAVSPDGRRVAYTIRADREDQLFVSPLDDLSRKTQLTFGPGSAVTPAFSRDGTMIFFSGDERRAYNIYSVHLETGEIRRYTDVRTGNFYPVPAAGEPGSLVFASFNKGAFQLFKAAPAGVVEKTVASRDLGRGRDDGLPAFTTGVSLEIDPDKVSRHKTVGQFYLASRPPIDAMIASDGSLYGGSAVAFTDILGDRTLAFTAYQQQQFRSYYGAFLNQRRRFQYMISAYQFNLYYYPNVYYYDPSLFGRVSYRDAVAVRSFSGVSLLGYYPFDRYYRAELGLSFASYEENSLNMLLGSGYFWNGTQLAASAALVGETTGFKSFGPVSGHTFRLAVTQALPVAESLLRNTTFEADLRKYLYLGMDSLVAVRFRGYLSRGRNPYLAYWGGNNTVRSANYYNVVGTEGWFANLELRLPLAGQVATLLGTVGPFRGVLFADVTRVKYGDFPAEFYQVATDGRLQAFDAIGSYGYGFAFYFLGLPLHLEFVKRLNIEDIGRPWAAEGSGGFRTKFWIGFDF